MEIEATVVKVMPPVKGTSARGEWTKQEVIFEQPGEFGKKVCISFWGDKAMDAAALCEGEQVKVSVNVESREYNGRWYTEVRAWKLAKAGPAEGAGAFAPPAHDPFAPGAGMPMPSSGTAVGGGEDAFDDLPF
ncbi:MAG: DUF3127 domain-containing protein [Rikenellaceae bacterium]|nr:DUF3127 domain-containing protein [Rikenellaceae bacterium]